MNPDEKEKAKLALKSLLREREAESPIVAECIAYFGPIKFAQFQAEMHEALAAIIDSDPEDIPTAMAALIVRRTEAAYRFVLAHQAERN